MKGILIILTVLASVLAHAGVGMDGAKKEMNTYAIFGCIKKEGKPLKFPLTLMLDTASGFGHNDSDFDSPIDGRIYYQYETGAIFGEFVLVKADLKSGTMTVTNKKTKEVVMVITEDADKVTYQGDDYSDCETIDPLTD